MWVCVCVSICVCMRVHMHMRDHGGGYVVEERDAWEKDSCHGLQWYTHFHAHFVK